MTGPSQRIVKRPNDDRPSNGIYVLRQSCGLADCDCASPDEPTHPFVSPHVRLGLVREGSAEKAPDNIGSPSHRTIPSTPEPRPRYSSAKLCCCTYCVGPIESPKTRSQSPLAAGAKATRPDVSFGWTCPPVTSYVWGAVWETAEWWGLMRIAIPERSLSSEANTVTHNRLQPVGADASPPSICLSVSRTIGFAPLLVTGFSPTTNGNYAVVIQKACQSPVNRTRQLIEYRMYPYMQSPAFPNVRIDFFPAQAPRFRCRGWSWEDVAVGRADHKQNASVMRRRILSFSFPTLR
ncbi:hypothetical protein CCHR01_17139 [Colletotrichum chrysophilum]|uniref:Uncharacterized protein n=1 Tax=Colletotrichum chrysophilum TaxID=1836956 RepID=A0AAD9A4Z6_9PEZI|nr:hypothetical protein CCHR01_17139 [Colletotrichum chrysophilum]